MHALKFALAASLLAFAVSQSAPAAEPDCMDTARSQTEMNGCAHQQYAEADAHLNAQYDTLISQLSEDGAQQQMLVEAQRHWIDFRDAECRFNASAAEGGSAQPMVRLLCLANVTTRRSTELDYYLNCSEGDLSCPTWNRRTN